MPQRRKSGRRMQEWQGKAAEEKAEVLEGVADSDDERASESGIVVEGKGVEYEKQIKGQSVWKDGEKRAVEPRFWLGQSARFQPLKRSDLSPFDSIHTSHPTSIGRLEPSPKPFDALEPWFSLFMETLESSSSSSSSSSGSEDSNTSSTMTPRTSLCQLPAELLTTIFELAIKPEAPGEEVTDSLKALQVLLASIHVSSHLRKINWNHRPIFRAIAGNLPSQLLRKAPFAHLLSFCSHRTDATLKEVSFGLRGGPTTPCFWDEVRKATEAVAMSTSSLQKLKLPMTSTAQAPCPNCESCTVLRVKSTQPFDDSCRAAIVALGCLFRKIDKTSLPKVLEAHLGDLINLASSSLPAHLSPQTLSLRLPNWQSSRSQPFWDRLCQKLQNLSVFNSMGADFARQPLEFLLPAAASRLVCLELHNCDLEGFELIDLPAVRKLRIAMWGELGAPVTLSVAKLPCLCFLDAPATVLRYIKASVITTASLTLERPQDAKVVISALMGWLKLESLVLHVDPTYLNPKKTDGLLSSILEFLNPGQKQFPVCPQLRRMCITSEFSLWSVSPETSTLVELSEETWWKQATRAAKVGEPQYLRPQMSYDPFQVLWERRALATRAKQVSKESSKDPKRSWRDYRVMETMKVIGCDISIGD